MSRDWIKMRTDLYRDPKVLGMVDWLMSPDSGIARYVNQQMQRDMTVTRNVMRNAVVGALVSVWGVMRHQGRRVDDDLVVSDSPPWILDDIADMDGFGDAMVAVGWAVESSKSLVFPRFFAKHNVEPGDDASEKNRERQRRFRESKRNESRNVTVTLQSNARVEKSRDREEKNIGGVPPITPLVRLETDADGCGEQPAREAAPKGLARLIEVWNGIEGIQPCRFATRKRITAWRQREGTTGWIDSVKGALQKLRESDFCHGANDRAWIADIDWFLRPDTVARLLEGKYDNRESNGKHGDSEASRAARKKREDDEFRAMIARELEGVECK